MKRIIGVMERPPTSVSSPWMDSTPPPPLLSSEPDDQGSAPASLPVTQVVAAPNDVGRSHESLVRS